MTYTNFNRVADIYDETRSVPSEIIDNFNEKILAFLSKRDYTPPYLFLSIGAGTGRVESKLITKKTQLFGIDISNLMLEKLKNKRTDYTSFLAIADGCSIPFRSSFHLAIGIHVTHFISDYRKLLQELENVAQFAVIGEIYVDSYTHPLYQKYKLEMEKLGWKKRPEGLLSVEFANFLINEGYNVFKEEISFPTNLSNTKIYDSIKKKLFSSQWKIPENLHETALQVLQKYIKAKKINLEDHYLTNAYLFLYFVDLREKFQ